MFSSRAICRMQAAGGMRGVLRSKTLRGGWRMCGRREGAGSGTGIFASRLCGLASWCGIFGAGDVCCPRWIRGEFIGRFGAGFWAGMFRKCGVYPPFSGVENPAFTLSSGFPGVGKVAETLWSGFSGAEKGASTLSMPLPSRLSSSGTQCRLFAKTCARTWRTRGRNSPLKPHK